MKHNIIYWLISISIFASGCQKNISTNISPENTEQTLQELLDEVVRSSHSSVPGVSMTVMAPDHNINWTGASGYDCTDKIEENLLSASQPFRIASVTKTFVATAILRLHEQGSAYIEHPISRYISSEHDSMLRAGGYATDSITLRHCLNHTSGLYDYAVGNNSYREKIESNPKKRWTRTEQLQLAMEIGQKYGDPGEMYHYSDTGYILLGEIIERVTGKNLGQALRELIDYEAHDMGSTWLEIIEEPIITDTNVVHRYYGRDDFTEVDASIDLYGGGGLISTTPDLASYFHNVFALKVYDSPVTLDMMMKAPDLKPAFISTNNSTYKDYRQGMYKVTMYGEDVYMHGGLWGTGIFHVPSLNTTVAINVTKGRWNRLVKKIVLLVKNLKDQNQ